MEGLQADVGVDEGFHNLVGSFLRDFFDVHTTRYGRDNRDFARGSVHQNREIKFLFDIHCFGEEERADDPALRAGLLGDDGVAEHFLCRFCGFGLGDKLYAALETVDEDALTASACVDLRLYDDVVAGDSRNSRVEFFGRFYCYAVLNGNAEFFE